MKIKGLHKCIYTLSRYADRHLNDENLTEREKSVIKWDRLRSEGVSERTCAELIGISRSTYYRSKTRMNKGLKPLISKRPKTIRKPTWTKEDEDLVFRVRVENSTYGKEKIHKILTRDYGFKKSQSTVGRIISKLKAKGLITRSLSALKPKRKRKFTKHAKKWEYGMKADAIGEMVQVDHMSVTKNQLHVKHFQAWDPTSKFIHAKLFSRATSRCAKKFLLELIEKSPFKITSIQVDGGSEFMLHFEEACEDLGIKLYVLPPKRPQYNGGVERGNRIFREEFYAKPMLVNYLHEIRTELSKALYKYNNYRPHHSIDLKTPMEYIRDTYLMEAA